jgi:hypothetical protein
LKQDLLEAGLAGLAVGVIAAIACHWAEAGETRRGRGRRMVSRTLARGPFTVLVRRRRS